MADNEKRMKMEGLHQHWEYSPPDCHKYHASNLGQLLVFHPIFQFFRVDDFFFTFVVDDFFFSFAVDDFLIFTSSKVKTSTSAIGKLQLVQYIN